MGVKVSPRGVFLKFLDAQGNLDSTKPVFFGTAAAFYGKTRPIHPNSKDPKYGSPDWLTDVLVADSEANLSTLPHSIDEEPYTSGSSKNVTVRWASTDASGQVQTNVLEGAQTIAVGYPMPNGATTGTTTPYMVEGFLVLPAGATLENDHATWPAWKNGVQYMKLE